MYRSDSYDLSYIPHVHGVISLRIFYTLSASTSLYQYLLAHCIVCLPSHHRCKIFNVTLYTPVFWKLNIVIPIPVVIHKKSTRKTWWYAIIYITMTVMSFPALLIALTCLWHVAPDFIFFLLEWNGQFQFQALVCTCTYILCEWPPTGGIVNLVCMQH